MTERVFRRIQDVPAAPTVVTIGAFDGVHRGHQHILSLAKDRAKTRDARLLVLTFDPLPIQLFRPEVFPGRIVTNERRRELLFSFGADSIVELPFTRELSLVTAESFMEHLFAIGPIHELWIGEDFALGHQRMGTASRLAELSATHGTGINAVPRVDYDGREVSSTAVRRMIIDGRADEASQIMGHRFQVAGEVVRGAQIGRTIGFPTANVAPPKDLVPLQDGIYASLAVVEGDERHFPAMTYIGTRPAVNTGQRMIETHLFDYDGDLYGKQLVTEFVCHLRQDADFPSVAELVAQLGEDERMARVVLENRQPGMLKMPGDD